MYCDRIRVLSRAYGAAKRNNKVYKEAVESSVHYQQQLNYVLGLEEQFKSLGLVILDREKEWREAILSVLEGEIVEDLAEVYPSDGYTVKLSSRVLRGKLHVEASVRSFYVDKMPGKIDGTQGRLFQQVVSFAALVGVMQLLGINTIYVDEAFSGSSKKNIQKANTLLKRLGQRGINVILIAQDPMVAAGMDVNRLLLERSVDNKTSVWQLEGENTRGN